MRIFIADMRQIAASRRSGVNGATTSGTRMSEENLQFLRAALTPVWPEPSSAAGLVTRTSACW